ncbi:MAG: ComF family protein [Clostridiales bacterium]|nr:ComF family protein [Clostridiales bacterium]
MGITRKTIKKMAEAIREFLLDIIYPPHCPGCDRLLSSGELVCASCDTAIKRIAEPVCKRCGKPLQNERVEYCPDCAKKRHCYKQGKAVFVYEGRIRQSLYRFKYGNKREYATFYAREAAALYGDWIKRRQIEAIVPIPMYPPKKRRRGYNQAECFARSLGRELGIPVEERLVSRTRNTVPQKELKEKERKRNLKNAFQFMPNIVKYKRVLLVDDIYTTGSTMDAVSEVLLSAGIDEAYYICISIGAGY